MKTNIDKDLRRKIGKEFAGDRSYVLSSRMGGKGRDICCGTVYRITKTGSMVYECEIMGCVANKEQWRNWKAVTKENYACGRPTAEKLGYDTIKKLVH